MDILITLREMYDSKLGKEPFPTKECASAGFTDRLHGELVMFLADIAGIASHGEKLATVSASRKLEFQRLTDRSFWERWPDARARVTPESTPNLYRRMEDTEKARLLIRKYLEKDTPA
jgi:hypothetical protein